MGYFESSLNENENIISKFLVHWVVWLKIGLYLVTGLIIIIPLYFFIKLLLLVIGIEQGLTDKRIIKKTGIISRNTEELLLTKVETVSVVQSILGRIFGYGDIIVSGTGISDIRLEYVPNPLEIKKKIESIV